MLATPRLASSPSSHLDTSPSSLVCRAAAPRLTVTRSTAPCFPVRDPLSRPAQIQRQHSVRDVREESCAAPLSLCAFTLGRPHCAQLDLPIDDCLSRTLDMPVRAVLQPFSLSATSVNIPKFGGDVAKAVNVTLGQAGVKVGLSVCRNERNSGIAIGLEPCASLFYFERQYLLDP